MFRKTITLIIIVMVLTSALTVGILAVFGQAEYSGQQWEYLTVRYGERFDAPSGPLVELVWADPPNATIDDVAITPVDCGEWPHDFLEGETEEEFEVRFQEFQECNKQNVHGRAFYLELLGNEGWELIQLTNFDTLSGQADEMIFKRPK